MKTLSKLLLTLAALASVALAPGVARAEGHHGAFWQGGGRSEHQARRIAAGAARGDLTPHETGYLRRRQDDLARYERDAQQKGWVTPYERERLHVERNEQSRQIEHLRRNDDRW